MKLLLFSDPHFGFGLGTEREDDAFECVQEALAQDCDAVLVGGDVFDVRTPPAEILAKAMEALLGPVLAPQTARLASGTRDVSALPALARLGRPVVAIAGNHDRRARGLLNPVQLLERAGFLVHLHGASVALEQGGERVVVHGLSGVPNHLAPAVFREWNPKPVPGACNILLFHQTLTPLFYAPGGFDMQHLPRGFDLYLCGDIHEAKQAEFAGKPLLVPGSVINTQLGKDAEQPKHYWTLDIAGGRCEIRSHEFRSQRAVRVLQFGEPPALRQLEERLQEIAAQPFPRKPLVRLLLPPGTDLPLGQLLEAYQDRLLLSFRRAGAPEPVPAGVSIEAQRLSVQELGRALLGTHFEREKLNPEAAFQLFELLLEGRAEAAATFLEAGGLGASSGSPAKPI